jgi:hypothetical protein
MKQLSANATAKLQARRERREVGRPQLVDFVGRFLRPLPFFLLLARSLVESRRPLMQMS